MLTVPRTVIEVATLVVAGILLSLAFVRMSSSEFVVFSAMLMAIVFRVAPLAIGVAGAMGVITQSIGETTINRKLLKDLSVSRHSQTALTSMNDLDMTGPAIELCNVSYSFPGAGVPVLENVDIEVFTNEVCAIIGASGSGKTTLLDCLMGLREISAGSVRIFGSEPNEIRKSHPGTMGLVIQSPSIRSGSIADNVAFLTTEKIDRELVSTLLFRVGLNRFLEDQPNGIDTLVGDGHLQMSGGEKQRLALARALYRNPRILIMDEPTSALDGLSESQVFELIEKEKRYRTVVLVTHRQPPSLIFDRIYEVRNGKVFSRPAGTE
jgi:ABC-type bacteriocin/lantibiotic exporter with double-glycine peptidase domain